MKRSMSAFLFAAILPAQLALSRPPSLPAVSPATSTARPAGHAGHGDMLMPREPAILDGYGQGGFSITTKSAQAQAFFDNGMQLAHAFAQPAAIAAFQNARRLDPGCAMCVWGEAWASGPTINDTRDIGETTAAAALTKKADELVRASGTSRERDLVRALGLRYRDGGGGKPGDLAFAVAMDRLTTIYPTDNEIGTIAADAWLIAPRAQRSGAPNSWRSMALLEAVLKRDPNYSPAIHFYIHASEATGQPARAESYADRLTQLAPKASHLVHMPSHTWYWVGRYQDAANANMRAVALGVGNAKRLGLPEPDGIWGLPYHEHNVTFGIGAALMAGDSTTALALGRPLIARAQVALEAPAATQMVSAEGYFAISRFADPKEMLSLPEPRLPFLQGYWHYGRGEALARLGAPQGVLTEAKAIPERANVRTRADDTKAATDLFVIARFVLLGRAAMLSHQPSAAINDFLKAAAVEENETLRDSYDPPAWWYPVRRDVAEARLQAGDLKGAVREADAALAERPRDPETMKIKARAVALLGSQ